MSESERLVKFTLLGQNFAFYTGASEEEMESILSMVREQIESIGGGDKPGGTIPVSKIAVMACLNLASNYIKLKQEYSSYKQDTAAKLEELSNRLDFVLVEEG
jgi:cell division protein ZapA (FtsZ GTPase activity inhibitor)